MRILFIFLFFLSCTTTEAVRRSNTNTYVTSFKKGYSVYVYPQRPKHERYNPVNNVVLRYGKRLNKCPSCSYEFGCKDYE
jgi:hypothetical protein